MRFVWLWSYIPVCRVIGHRACKCGCHCCGLCAAALDNNRATGED